MSDDASEHRIERDTMGEVRVPKNALWRAQTQRAGENFPISGTPLEREHIKALALVKGAAAASNDVFPTSIHVAATDAVINNLIPGLGHLADALGRKAAEFESVVKSGRTHL